MINANTGGTLDLFASFAAKAWVRGWRVRDLAAGYQAILTTAPDAAELLRQFAHEDDAGMQGCVKGRQWYVN